IEPLPVPTGKNTDGFWDFISYCSTPAHSTLQLIINSGTSTGTVIARFHCRKLILSNTPPGYLEIVPPSSGIVDDVPLDIDTILTTFIYIEKLRRDKERSVSKTNGA
ncbi:hypothetical protein BT96DRAFT_1058803, partial [Gymnopus androsaceus JB14]